ncbi:MAG: stress response translation initiation inhibitor YciH [Porticoccaceae bacterium]|jgi:translation initiation factor 1|nr:stress response translation initiation inhibitor YciH [Porticoccaceae bacterium]MBT3799032.1 stress response translation initiation inhibitor YciH [Porticoccaceae bacterium]MBT4164730.1 stress response translation initiation inhibitor YciH [Porticoccaceae bacterium]MBT4212470.1 stress response translation initiation inhibitor YciH [Porticoccaceae bacterium]MBT4591821.1 stress response translation initiation inhibitor YciH [Porticoccaceae bacterium]
MANKESRLVYSTDVGRVHEREQPQVTLTDGIVRIRRETKGRKGKGVTTVSGIDLPELGLKALAKQLKQKCSTGGTVKSGVIEVQGDHRDLLKKELEKRGHNVKLAGG